MTWKNQQVLNYAQENEQAAHTPLTWVLDTKRGLIAAMPIMVGYFPIAVAFGALSQSAGLTPVSAVAMSVFVFAGASQFIAVELLRQGTAIFAIVVATFIINLRHMVMSASLAQRMGRVRGLANFLVPFSVTDETFAVATLSRNKESMTAAYWAGLAGGAYLSWVSGTAFGALFANFIPRALSGAMAVGLYAMFIGLLIPGLSKTKGAGYIALLGALLAWGANQVVSRGWAIILAALAASAIGAVLDLIKEPDDHEHE